MTDYYSKYLKYKKKYLMAKKNMKGGSPSAKKIHGMQCVNNVECISNTCKNNKENFAGIANIFPGTCEATRTSDIFENIEEIDTRIRVSHFSQYVENRNLTAIDLMETYSQEVKKQLTNYETVTDWMKNMKNICNKYLLRYKKSKKEEKILVSEGLESLTSKHPLFYFTPIGWTKEKDTFQKSNFYTFMTCIWLLSYLLLLAIYFKHELASKIPEITIRLKLLYDYLTNFLNSIQTNFLNFTQRNVEISDLSYKYVLELAMKIQEIHEIHGKTIPHAGPSILYFIINQKISTLLEEYKKEQQQQQQQQQSQPQQPSPSVTYSGPAQNKFSNTQKQQESPVDGKGYPLDPLHIRALKRPQQPSPSVTYSGPAQDKFPNTQKQQESPVDGKGYPLDPLHIRALKRPEQPGKKSFITGKMSWSARRENADA